MQTLKTFYYTLVLISSRVILPCVLILGHCSVLIYNFFYLHSDFMLILIFLVFLLIFLTSYTDFSAKWHANINLEYCNVVRLLTFAVHIDKIECALKQFTQLVKSFINVFRVTHILNQYLNQGLIFAIGSIETRKSFLFQENLL